MNAVLEQPVTRAKNRGKKLAAEALLAQGYSKSKVAELSGLSRPTVRQIANQNLVPSSHIEPIKRALRDRMALVADLAINGISQDKLTEASALECMKVADLAMKNAGLAPPSITENYSFSVSKYVNSTGSATEEKVCEVPQILKTAEGK